MNIFATATKKAVSEFQETGLCHKLCGSKPFGSRHWEYPWAVEHSGILESTGLKILDVAPDLTFPYPHAMETMGHQVTFIDLEKRRWSEKTVWGVDPHAIKDNFHVMDVRSMSFPDDIFDCIFCISVLEHIVCPTQDPDHPRLQAIFDPLGARSAISEMKRCLAPGGKLIITVDLYGGSRWKHLFSKWDIFSDLAASGFYFDGQPEFDAKEAFSDPDTFLSEFHGPYITIGFRVEKDRNH